MRRPSIFLLAAMFAAGVGAAIAAAPRQDPPALPGPNSRAVPVDDPSDMQRAGTAPKQQAAI